MYAKPLLVLRGDFRVLNMMRVNGLGLASFGFPLFFGLDHAVANTHHGLKNRLLLCCSQCLPYLLGIGCWLRQALCLLCFHRHTPLQPAPGYVQRSE